MHKDFRLTNNDNKVKRLFYNSTLVYSESVFPFHSNVTSSNTENLKNLRINLAFYKEKLQNQYKKCRDYLKEEISQSTETSGILKEVVLENMCGESKRKLLNRLHKMGLRIKEAVGTKETLIMVDLSPISSNKEAVNKFMEFIEKERERLSKLKAKKYATPKLKDVSIQKDLNLNCSYRRLPAGKKLKTTNFKNNNKDAVINENLNYGKQYNKSSIIKIYPPAKTDDEHKQKVSNLRLLPSPRQPHYYEPNPSLFLETIYSPTSKDSKYDKNEPPKHRKLRENQLSSKNIKDLQKIKSKSNNPKDYNNSENQIHQVNGGSFNITNNKFENLFKSQPLPNLENVESEKEMTKKTKEKKKKNKINRIFNILKYFFINKQKKYAKKEKEIINKNGGYSIISYHVESAVPRGRGSENRSVVSFNSNVEIIVDKMPQPSVEAEVTINDENIQNGGKKRESSLLLNEPSVVWGREIWIDSEKEKELLLSAERSKKTRSSIKVAAKKQHNNDDDEQSNKTTEVRKILKQQTKIKEMIENIHNTLNCHDTTTTDMSCSQNNNSGYDETVYSDECYDTESAASCKCDTNLCTSEVWSEKATVSNGGDSCWHKSFNESMTNIPNSSCWCIEFCEKLSSLCFSWCKKTESDTKLQNELLNQRREILKLNKLLGCHLLNEHPTQSRECC